MTAICAQVHQSTDKRQNRAAAAAAGFGESAELWMQMLHPKSQQKRLNKLLFLPLFSRLALAMQVLLQDIAEACQTLHYVIIVCSTGTVQPKLQGPLAVLSQSLSVQL